jgi:uncharacterized protein
VRPRILPLESPFFATFLAVPTAKLVYTGPDPRAIAINQPRSTAQGGRIIATAFADAGPYLLATEASFEDVNGRLERKLDIIRFRPNVVVGGTVAWDEDDWKLIFIDGLGVFHVIARCPRCQLPKYIPSPSSVVLALAVVFLTGSLLVFWVGLWVVLM